MTSRDWNFPLESPDDNDWEAYVGLRKKNGLLTLRVPHGYPKDNDVKVAQQILDELTRAVMRFSEAFSDADRSSYDGRSTRDGFLKGGGGQSFNFDSNGAELGYTHFFRYGQLIRMLRDPRLLSLTKAPGLTAQFDHRYIARNLERAMYLPDGTPVFDLSWASRTQMRHTGSDMVGLACWMALDALKKLFPDSSGHEVGAALQSEWEEWAHRFADEHELDANASLFSGKRTATLPLLQTALETCVRLAPPVSSDARELHHLLDELLHYALDGQDGDIWGLQEFHHVWEAACLEYAIEKYGEENTFTCDDEYLSPDISPKSRGKWAKNRCDVFAKNGIARRPDLVIKNKDGTYLIVDFKYYSQSESKKFIDDTRPSVSKPPSLPKGDDWTAFKRDYAAFSCGYKTVQDIASIEAYRWLLMQHEIESPDESKVALELWVPGMEGKEVPMRWRARKGDYEQFGALVYKPARDILRDYASKYRLMD